MRHEAWSDGSFFPIINLSARSLVEEGSKIIWCVEAVSWDDAMARYNEWKGYEPYRPMDEDDPGIYSADEEAESARMCNGRVESDGTVEGDA